VYTVGRAKESDISVPSQMVSRHHGQFLFEKGVWVYVDLKSSNGSRVGGKRVERVVLQSGDVVDVGGFMITYKEIHDLSQVTETPEDEGKTMAIDPSMLKRAALAGVDGVALLGGLGGSLADISMPDILQLLEMQKKNGTLSFDFEGAYGKIFLKNGMMIHAEYGKLTGEIAVTRMLHKAKGTFHLDPRDPKSEQSIHRPTTTVLMDAARSMDERSQ
jgi:pSer/pThr/pTyr-binding forkhead associated (FHA) protein